jgi:hypothetical protein
MVRYFRCQECGTLNPATKSKGFTGPGHIKSFWCHKCQKKTDQVQVDMK